MKTSTKWLVIILALLVALNCNRERKQLLMELERLDTQIEKYSEISNLVVQLDYAKKELIKRTALIGELRRVESIVDALRPVPSLIPIGARFNKLYSAHGSLNLYIVFPGNASVEKLLNNIEKTAYFKKIDYTNHFATAPVHNQHAGKSANKKGQLSYKVSCKYLYPPYSYADYQRPPSSLVIPAGNRGGGVGAQVPSYDSKSNEDLLYEIQKREKGLRFLEANRKMAPRIREEIEQYKAILSLLELTLPRAKDIKIKQIAEEIRETASLFRIKIDKLQPMPKRKKYVYYEYPFSMELTVEYAKIIDFLQVLKLKDKIFHIAKLRIQPSKGTLRQKRLKMSLVLSTFSMGEKKKRKKRVQRNAKTRLTVCTFCVSMIYK